MKYILIIFSFMEVTGCQTIGERRKSLALKVCREMYLVDDDIHRIGDIREIGLDKYEVICWGRTK